MKEFLDTIRQMHGSSAKDSFPNLFAFFKKINTLNRDEVLAASQAFDAFRWHVLSEQESEANEDVIDKIRDAIIARMCMICCDTPAEIRSEVATVFWRATGHSLAIQKFIRREPSPEITSKVLC